MAIDLTQYLPKALEMRAGEWTITSPVPSVETGKVISAFQALQAEQARRAENGEPLLEESVVEGFPETSEGLARLLLGDGEYERLVGAGCPFAYVLNAATAALVYWANGGSEEAVYLYHQALTDTTETESVGVGGGPKVGSR